jgi:putative membrane protein
MKNIIRISIALLWLSISCANAQNQNQNQNQKSTDSKTNNSSQNQKSNTKNSQSSMNNMSDEQFAREAAHGGLMEVQMGQMAQTKAVDQRVKNFAAMMVRDHTKSNNELRSVLSGKNMNIDMSQMEKDMDMNMNMNKDMNKDMNNNRDDEGKQMNNGNNQMNTGNNQMNNSGNTGNTGTGNTGNSGNTGNNQVKSSGNNGNKHMHDMHGLNDKTGADFDKAYMEMMVSDHKKDISLFEKESKNGKDSDLRSFATRTLPTLRMHLDSATSINSYIKGMKSTMGLNEK